MLRLFGKLMHLIAVLLLLAIFAGAGIFVYARWVETRMLTVTRETVISPRVGKDAQGLTIVQFSDIHICDDDDRGKPARIAEAINREDPDIVVFTGDLFDNFPAYDGDLRPIVEAFSRIKARVGRYAVPGNHDCEKSALPVVKKLWADAGFTFLCDESVYHAQLGLQVVGLDDWLFGSRSTEALEQADPDAFTLLLCHEPDAAAKLDTGRFDLMLSGHTHGGQIRLPLLGIVYTPALGRIYREGRFELEGERGAVLLVNRGTGQSLLPLRFMVPPELTVVTLQPDS